MENEARRLRATRRLLEERGHEELARLLDETHPTDLAALLRELSPEQQVVLFKSLDPDRAGEVLPEVDNDTLLALIRGLDENEVSRILEGMPAEDAAGVVAELSAERAEKVLDLMKEEQSEGVEQLLGYREQTAGRLMSTDVVAITDSATVGSALEDIRKLAPEGRPFEVYVVDAHHHLLGVVPLRRLLTADPATPMTAILEPDIVSVAPETDQEEVARVVARYDLVAVPVVDRSNRLIGEIRIEDVIDILRDEASEDILRLAGSDAEELERRSPRRIALLRLPWVLTTLLIELLAGVVISYFDETLSRVILLASFMPVIQAISGNTGLQSATLIVRGLATGQVRLARWWEHLWRQVQVTSLIGGVCALVVGAVGFVWHGTLAFGATVAVSMFISVNLSGTAGTLIPMLSKRMGFDPALTAGPFETAFQDVVGVTIFLSLATALLRWLA